MNKLNIEALGLQEMTREEMMTTYGGNMAKLWAGAVSAAVAVCDAVSDFCEGWNSVKC